MAIADVIKFESNADIFAWKFPNSEIGTWSQLIVNESQEAILFKNGQAADVFGPGRYTLSTDNIPILRNIISIPFGKKSPFSAEVWFINKAFSLDIKWGTVSPIQIQDPKYNVFIPLRAFGQFGIQVEDSKRFLIKLVGTMRFFNRNTLTDYFRGLYMTRVKDIISSCLINSKISLLEINAHLNEISDILSQELSEELEEYGIRVVSFYVNDINVPENDPAVKQLKSALAKRAEMDIIGYNYQQERTFNTLETAADNGGSAGSVMGAGIGLGMGFGIGGAVGNQAQGLASAMSTEGTKECPSCHSKIKESTKFCSECGYDTTKKASSGVKCPNCGSTVEAGKKFCSECGTPLIKNCANCGKTLGPNEKFCSECGTKC